MPPSAVLEVANLQSDNSPVCQAQDNITKCSLPLVVGTLQVEVALSHRFQHLRSNSHGLSAMQLVLFSPSEKLRKQTSHVRNDSINANSHAREGSSENFSGVTRSLDVDAKLNQFGSPLGIHSRICFTAFESNLRIVSIIISRKSI